MTEVASSFLLHQHHEKHIKYQKKLIESIITSDSTASTATASVGSNSFYSCSSSPSTSTFTNETTKSSELRNAAKVVDKAISAESSGKEKQIEAKESCTSAISSKLKNSQANAEIDNAAGVMKGFDKVECDTDVNRESSKIILDSTVDSSKSNIVSPTVQKLGNKIAPIVIRPAPLKNGNKRNSLEVDPSKETKALRECKEDCDGQQALKRTTERSFVCNPEPREHQHHQRTESVTNKKFIENAENKCGDEAVKHNQKQEQENADLLSDNLKYYRHSNSQPHQRVPKTQKDIEILSRLRHRQTEQCNFPVKEEVGGRRSLFYHPTQMNTIGKAYGHKSQASEYRQHLEQNQVKLMRQAALGHSNSSGQSDRKVNSHILDQSHNTTPLFERMVTEEVQEIKSYIKMIESLNRRLSQMEYVHDELETRLENSTKEKVELEYKIDEMNNTWSMKYLELEQERSAWEKRYEEEKERNEQMRQQMNRKDIEIHRMIQRKYDSNKNLNSGLINSNHGFRRSESAQARSENFQARSSDGHNAIIRKNRNNVAAIEGKSPYDMLVERGSTQNIKERDVIHSLLDFFGI